MNFSFSDVISIIAIIISIIMAIITIKVEAKKSNHENFRNFLMNDLAVLSSELYSLLSCLKIYQSKVIKSGSVTEFAQKWLDKIEKSKNNIIAIRLKLRYPFNGRLIDELKTYAQIANIGMYYVKNQDQFDAFFGLANKFRKSLDKALQESFEKGVSPSDANIASVQNSIYAIEMFLEQTKPTTNTAAELSSEDLKHTLKNDF